MKKINYMKAIIVFVCYSFINSYFIGNVESYQDDTLEKIIFSGELEKAKELINEIEQTNIKHYWMGRLYFNKGDYFNAKNEIKTCLNVSFPDDKLQRLFLFYNEIDRITKSFRETSGEHFVIRAEGINLILCDYALNALEKAYEQIGKDLNYFPENKVIVEIFTHKDNFALASTLGKQLLEKSGTVGICKFNRIMILSPQNLPLGFRWLDTLAHEYTHYIINRKSKGECSLWLHEGIARYHDTRWRLEKPIFLNSAGKNQLVNVKENKKFITFERMSPSLVYLKDQDEITLAFAEVALTIDLIKKEYGHKAVGKLLENLSIYKNEDIAFKKTIGIKPEKLEKKLIKYVKSLDIKESKGVINDQPKYQTVNEEDFIGADQKGLIRLGDKMRNIKRYKAALIQYNKALVKEPSNPVILLKIAKTHILLNDFKNAEKYLLDAIKGNPNYVTLYQVLGELYFKQKSFDKSIEIYLESISMNPFHPETHRNISRCYIATEQYEKAIKELRIALALNPSDIETKVILQRLRN